MESELFQTLHPKEGKKNKPISLERYELVKSAILELLTTVEPTYSEMADGIKDILPTSFDGSIRWYTETVSLDLEARGLIERMETRPQRYRLIKP